MGTFIGNSGVSSPSPWGRCGPVVEGPEEVVTEIPERQRHSGARLVFAGAVLLVAQNSILLLALVLALAIDVSTGFTWARAALLLDLPGVALLGAGLVRLASRTGEGGASATGGILCFGWLGLTLAWRWILPGLSGRGFEDILIAIWGSDGTALPELPSMGLAVHGMLVLWIVASAVLVAIPLSLRTERGWPLGAVLLEGRVEPRTWEGFVALNATGTFLVAGSLLAILGGASVGWPLQAGVLIKVAFAPSSGAFAYAQLGRRARRSLLGRETGPTERRAGVAGSDSTPEGLPHAEDE